MPQYKLLCIGHDALLLDLRLRLLARHYSVEGASELYEMRRSATQDLDVILLCHTLSDEERQAVITLAQERWPKARLLSIFASQAEFDTEGFDAQVRALDGPEALLRSVERLVQ